MAHFNKTGLKETFESLTNQSAVYHKCGIAINVLNR